MLNQTQTNQTNPLLVPQAERVLDQMKQEIAQEFGITLGAETSSRDNGKIGGEMTKRLVKMAEEMLNNNQIH